MKLALAALPQKKTLAKSSASPKIKKTSTKIKKK